MKILVYGAGVVGSILASRLSEARRDVTILARGPRFAYLQQEGIVLQAANLKQRTVSKVPVVDCLEPDDAYDLVLVVMRKNQVASILPALAANRRTPNVLFMGNNVAGAEEYVRALGKERVLLGFGGVGGIRKDNEIRYMAVMKGDLGRAYAGELDGSFSARLKEIARAFQKTGIPLDVLRNPDAWLKTHAAVILPLACAIYRAGGDNYRLAKDRRTRTLMMHGVRESLRVLQGAGVPITPPAYQMYLKLPMMIQVALVGNLLSSQHAAISVAGHANAARDEMQTLADEFTGLIRKSGVAAPVLNELYGEIPRLP